MEYVDGRSYDIGTLAVRPGHRHPEHGRPVLARDACTRRACCANAEALVRPRRRRRAQFIWFAVRQSRFFRLAEPTWTQ
jgi:hypothetical protein